MTLATNGATAPLKPSRNRRYLRPGLRQATFIIPGTGARSKRHATLQGFRAFENANEDETSDRSPLLRQDNSRAAESSIIDLMKHKCWGRLKSLWTFTISTTGQGVLKCSLAYLLGSMATFVPVIAKFLGHQDGKHMVATITVYFHPSRSQGSMFEAVLLALLAFLYAAFICFTSMGVSVFFGQVLDLIVLGHVVVLVLFCGGGLGFVGWVKLKLGNPLVNVACSLTSLAIITVLTKEGSVQAATFSDHKVIQVMKMVIMGVVVSTAVCFLIKPVSARKALRENMIQVTDSFADMLAMITRSFLTGSEEELLEKPFIEASDRYRVVYTSLAKNLKEARYEHYVIGTERQYKLEAKLVKCMQRLAQSIGGLRSAAATQFQLLAQDPPVGCATPVNSSYIPINTNLSCSIMAGYLMSPQENHSVLASIDEAPEEESNDRKEDFVEDYSELPTVNLPSDIFERFIAHLGPSLKSLAFTLKQILDELPYGPAPDFHIAVNKNFRTSLIQAIGLYSAARKEALVMLYKNKELKRSRPAAVEADFEEVAASCGHFSFSLQDFAEELKVYLDILDDLKLEVDQSPRIKSWSWLKIWRKDRQSKGFKHGEDVGRNGVDDRNDEVETLEDAMIPRGREFASVLDPDEEPKSVPLTYRIWKGLRVLRRDDVKFAIKVGVGAALFAWPSFTGLTRPFYQHWRGEWGLLSYMLVCSMTIGASNTTGIARFLGTCIGAVCAIVAWTTSRGNVFAIAAFGWLMSLWTFYLIIGRGKGPLGRFIMLTYNLSALYAYSLSVRDEDHDDDEGGMDPIITEIVTHRVVAVLSGCLWGIVITRLVWPISARQKFKDGLSLLWLRMGLIWKRDPLAVLLEGESPNVYINLREEFELQRFLTRLDALRSSASSEFELKAPFPNVIYDRILKSTSKMLDAFHAMNVVIMKDLKASPGEAEILKYTIGERAQLCARISHLFQVLASSLKIEYPLNNALPSTDHARDRLLARIFTYRRNDRAVRTVSDEDFALLYAYVLVTGQLSKEIQEVGLEIEKLFGTLDEDSLKLQ